jgi:hypothetical protein
MSGDLKLSVILRAVDHLSAPLNNLNARLEAMQGPTRRLGSALNNSLRLTGVSQITRGLRNVGSEVGSLAVKLTALGGVAGFAFKRMFIDTAAEFENYKITLETFYGTSEKAQGAMDWVSGFAASTPYQLGEVTKGFIELKSFGLDPTSGALKAAGDAAAAMGKPLDMATNTLASALRGQAEMLDNFGIFGRIEKDMMVFDWVDKAGKKFHKEVNKTNRDEIAKTITGIWQQKFGGSMDRLSHGFTGIMSNIQDNFTRLAVKVMESGGSFSFLKDELQKVLDKLNYLQTPEGLKETEKSAVKLRKALGEIKAFAKEAWKGINKLADAVGGFGNLAKLVFGGIALVMTGPLLLAIYSVTAAIGTMTLAMMANPALLAIGLMSAAVLLLWKNWDGVVGGFKQGINDIKNWFAVDLMAGINSFVDGVKSAFSLLWDAITGIGRAIKSVMQFKNPFSGGELMFPMPDGAPGAAGTPGTPGTPGVPGTAGAPGVPGTAGALPTLGAPVALPALGKPLALVPSKSQPASNQKIDTGGTINLKIDSATPVKVTSMKTNDPRQIMNVDAGLTMAGAR